MKKLFGISLLLVLCLSLFVSAGADLVVQKLEILSDTIEPKGVYHYVLEIKNVGDRDAVTRLPAEVYFPEIYDVAVYPGSLTAHMTKPRTTGNEPISPMAIILPDGSEKSLTPEYKAHPYMAPPESPEKIKERKDSFLLRAKDMGYAQEEIDKELADIDKTYGNYHEVIIEGFFITLQPGETARYESAKTYNQNYPLNFPVGALSIEPIKLTLAVLLDPFSEADLNLANNDFTKEVTMSPNVLQGPKPETDQNVELKSDMEYFAYSAGCTTIRNKEICVSTDDKEELLFVSVDGEKETYSFYGLFLAWINKIFGDGKLAPTEENNGVEITLYMKGFKFKFLE